MSTHTWLTAETDNESDSDGEAGGSTPAKPGPIRWLTADTPPSIPHSQSALLGLEPPLGVLPPEGNRVPRSYSAQPPQPPEFDVPNMEMGLAARLTVKGYLPKNSGFSDALQRLSKAAASAS